MNDLIAVFGPDSTEVRPMTEAEKQEQLSFIENQKPNEHTHRPDPTDAERFSDLEAAYERGVQDAV